MSISTEITRLQTAKADLKTAIEAKGVAVGDITIDGYAAKVAEIPTGGATPPETPTDSILFYSENEIGLGIYNRHKNWWGTLYYSTDHTNWNTWDGTTTLTSVESDGWHKIYLRGTGNHNFSSTHYAEKARFVVRGSLIKCVGDLDNLLDYTTTTHTMYANAFYGMFYQVGNVDFDIKLPTATATSRCYQRMFYGCSSLTKAPAIPETLSTYCCQEMFQGCSSLITPPSLPATTLTDGCYTNMFQDCSSLTATPALPATTLTNYCYNYMFYGCSSLTLAQDLPATTLKSNCYAQMFYNCTSLITPPAISATVGADSCCASMFQGCTSLTTAPAIHLTSFSYGDCQNMFQGCTSLTTIPELPATTLVSSCYNSMFYGCTNIKLSTEQTGEYQTEYRIPSSGTGTSSGNTMNGMFTSTGGTFVGTPTINTTYYTSNTVIPAT